MDFRNNSRKFADPDFDGDPVQVFEPTDGKFPDDMNGGDSLQMRSNVRNQFIE